MSISFFDDIFHYFGESGDILIYFYLHNVSNLWDVGGGNGI